MKQIAYLKFGKRTDQGQKQRINITRTDENSTIYTAATRECEW